MDHLERRTTPDGIAWLISSALNHRDVLVAFTERTGGVSGDPFGSLNLGFKEGDLPVAVRRNRELVVEALGIPPFATAEQVHGSVVEGVDATRAGLGFGKRPGLPGCDALVTTAPDVPLAILTADCVPLALADDERVAAVHAGWKGIAGGMVASALGWFPEPRRVAAAIGPAIGPCHYEVGEEVVRAVRDTEPSAPAERRDGAWYLDLPATVEASLRGGGVRDIERSALCTACETDRFFSFRRDGRTGRQAMVVVRR